MRVAAGAIAKKYLQQKFGIVIRGCLTQMGDIPLAIKDWDQVELNPFFCADADKLDALDELMRGLKKRATPLVRKSPWWPTVCRLAGASRYLTASTLTSPTR